MNILGLSSGFHDAAAALVDPWGNIVFASQSERYSGIKNDPNLSLGLMAEIAQYPINEVAYYERPWVKQLCRLRSGQGIEWNKLTARQVFKDQLGGFCDINVPIKTYSHHLCHAAAGFQTSPFQRATVVVIDAIGEWDTVSIWSAEYVNGQAKYKKLWGQKYPHSIGLFYSAITERVGLNPMDEEYITMGMAAYGDPIKYLDAMSHAIVADYDDVEFKDNLHVGLGPDFLPDASNEDIAAAAQFVVEKLILHVMSRATQFGWSDNLVYMGGVALNCSANRLLGEYFENIWIMPCPGDSGSAIGAAALAHGGALNWNNAFLGHNIVSPYPVRPLVNHLLVHGIAGVANGRAEFGPRALGNRSLLADPRGADIKDRVNEIKRRQKFRPFAPVILEELADTYFDMPRGWGRSRYMQTVARCRVPELFPAIVHADGTSRVQTVANDKSGMRRLLEAWYAETGCPMLLNTSLNIRGKPMVNNRQDADHFEQQYNVKVFS